MKIRVEAKEFVPSVVEGAAKCMWGLAWADELEEYGLSHHISGMDILDAMPPVPQKATDLAKAFIEKVQSLNNVNLAEFIPPGSDPETWSLDDEESLGHYLVLEAMGHGATWMDDHEEHGLKLPYLDGVEYELEEDAERAIKEEFGSEIEEVLDTDSDEEEKDASSVAGAEELE